MRCQVSGISIISKLNYIRPGEVYRVWWMPCAPLSTSTTMSQLFIYKVIYLGILSNIHVTTICKIVHNYLISHLDITRRNFWHHQNNVLGRKVHQQYTKQPYKWKRKKRNGRVVGFTPQTPIFEIKMIQRSNFWLPESQCYKVLRSAKLHIQQFKALHRL